MRNHSAKCCKEEWMDAPIKNKNNILWQAKLMQKNNVDFFDWYWETGYDKELHLSAIPGVGALQEMMLMLCFFAWYAW